MTNFYLHISFCTVCTASRQCLSTPHLGLLSNLPLSRHCGDSHFQANEGYHKCHRLNPRMCYQKCRNEHQCVSWLEAKNIVSCLQGGDNWESNPGPLAPKARIIPLDHYPVCTAYWPNVLYISIDYGHTGFSGASTSNHFDICGG